MGIEQDIDGGAVTPAQARAALDRMLATNDFRNSPQLAAFLRFVVEAVLRGESGRLKGYTIGVKALGRPENFDPQIDPIVRVEATRLRRTLGRYYSGAGADDVIEFAMSPGSYVPTIRRRRNPAGDESKRNESPPIESPPRPTGDILRGLLRSRLVLAAAATLAVFGVVVAAVLALRGDAAAPRRGDAIAPSQAFDGPLQPGNGLPTLAVQEFEVMGPPASAGGPRVRTPAPVTTAKVRAALARFETVNVASSRADGETNAATEQREPAADYRLSGTGWTHNDGTATVEFRLADADGTIFWSRSIGPFELSTEYTAISDQIVRQLAMTLGPPFGVIRTRERVKQLASGAGDPRGRCLLEASEALRSFDPARHGRARHCLELLTARDPSFALGFSYLASVYRREHQYHPGTGDPSLLDRAMRAAQHGVELNPESARAHQMLANVLFAQQRMAAALAASERAVALNPHDPTILSDHGGRLIMTGAVDRGLEALSLAAADGAVRLPWHQFYLFLGSYLKNDMAAASRQASLITSEAYPLGLLARSLAAAADGDRDQARKTYAQLVALRPAWRDAPRAELARLLPAPALIDRLSGDLEKAGLGTAR